MLPRDHDRTCKVEHGIGRQRVLIRTGRKSMAKRIVAELQTPGDSRTLFRLLIDDIVVGENLTAVQAHVLTGEIFARITMPRRAAGAPRAESHQEAIETGDRRLTPPSSLAARVAALDGAFAPRRKTSSPRGLGEAYRRSRLSVA